MAYRQWTKADLDRPPLEWDLRQARARIERAIAQGCSAAVVAAARECEARIVAEMAEGEAAR